MREFKVKKVEKVVVIEEVVKLLVLKKKLVDLIGEFVLVGGK